MYAIVEIGGLQYKVSKGELVDVALTLPKKKEYSIDRVLLIKENKDVVVGTPYLKDAKIVCDVVSHIKGRKVIAFKYKRRKRQKAKKGFRAKLVRLKVKEIKVGG